MEQQYALIDRDPRFQALIRRRSRLGWGLTGIVLATYYAFIFCIAWQPAWLATPLAGSWLTAGLASGLGIIASSIGLTGLYVHRANAEFDTLNAAIVRDAHRHE